MMYGQTLNVCDSKKIRKRYNLGTQSMRLYANDLDGTRCRVADLGLRNGLGWLPGLLDARALPCGPESFFGAFLVLIAGAHV
jgi:hypothetical protein